MKPPLGGALRSQAVAPIVGPEAREKWTIGGAFGLAVLLHLALIGLAAFWSSQPEGMLVSLAPGSVEVLIQADSPLDDSAPPPDIELPPPPPTPPDEFLFTEETFSPRPPPVPQKVSRPIAKVRSGKSGSPSLSSALALALSAPWPEYPPIARQNRITGDGIAVMTIDSSGSVTHVSMSKSTGDSSLDDAALRSFRRWRFRPGTVSKVRAPVTFRLTAQLD
jgi:protein TonB